ncbi:MAG: CCA tRNA nucleotidyltransferase [Clostridia bacterium]|nr:CCA tRNA nucleotidyltransferase [Clostridia bacterium]
MTMPETAEHVIQRLNRAGYRAYLVGGCVRDLLMGRTASDVDITTSALPEQTTAVFADCSPFFQGGRFGTVGIIRQGQKVEITTFRTEEGYSDCRRPDTVHFVEDVRLDLARRDFTVNSMALHPQEGLIDPFGGQNDLRARLLRTTGEAPLRFGEDALRILRLFRFCAKLGFDVEPQTLAAARSLRGGLASISAERITAELCELLTYDDGRAVRLMADCGIFSCIGFEREPSVPVYDAQSKDVCLRLALLCRQTQTPPARLFERLRLTNLQQRRVAAFAGQLEDGAPQTAVEVKRRMRLLSPEDLAAVSYCWPQGQTVRACIDSVLHRREPYLISHLAVGGAELLAAGAEPKEIGSLLEQALETVLAQPEKNQPQLLLRQLLRREAL